MEKGSTLEWVSQRTGGISIPGHGTEGHGLVMGFGKSSCWLDFRIFYAFSSLDDWMILRPKPTISLPKSILKFLCPSWHSDNVSSMFNWFLKIELAFIFLSDHIITTKCNWSCLGMVGKNDFKKKTQLWAIFKPSIFKATC